MPSFSYIDRLKSRTNHHKNRIGIDFNSYEQRVNQRYKGGRERWTLEEEGSDDLLWLLLLVDEEALEIIGILYFSLSLDYSDKNERERDERL